MGQSQAQTSGSEVSPVAWGLLLILSGLWGGSFLFIEIAVAEIPPLTLVFGRVTLAAVTLWAFVFLMRLRMNLSWRLVGIFLVMGLVNNAVPFTLISWGQIHISASLASILNATTPIFAVLLAHCLTADDGLTYRKAIGVLIGFLGVAVIVGPGAFGELSLENMGQIAVVAASFSYAMAAIINRQVRAVPPMVSSAGMLTAAAFWLLPAAAISEWPLASMPSTGAWAALCALALVSTALAYLLFFRLIVIAGTTNATLVTFIIPMSTIGLGIAFLGEEVSLQQFAGLLIILLGLSLIDGRLLQWFRSAARAKA